MIFRCTQHAENYLCPLTLCTHAIALDSSTREGDYSDMGTAGLGEKQTFKLFEIWPIVFLFLKQGLRRETPGGLKFKLPHWAENEERGGGAGTNNVVWIILPMAYET